MEVFRLKKLIVKDNVVFKSETKFEFSKEDSYSFQAPYFTLIIGPNGTGKSNLLKLLIDIFRIAYEQKVQVENLNYPSGKYYLEYFMTDGNYVITNSLGWDPESSDYAVLEDEDTRGIRFFRDGKRIEKTRILIPEGILALSIMLTDKFPVFKDADQLPMYNYLGVRRNSNTAGTRSYISKTIEFVLQSSTRQSFISDVKELLAFLELQEEFFISYSPRYKHIFFRKNITQEFFEGFFLNNSEYLDRETLPWSVGVFKALQESEPEVIPELVKLVNYMAENLVPYEDSRALYFEVNVFDPGKNVTSILKYLPYLHRLDIISYPYITLKKEGYYLLQESSSGEYHFIATIIGLLATIRDNSLVLIDEPEISLHPNWQMKYIGFLNSIMKRHSSSHFIICTHSHFMVSDLEPRNSSIVALRKEKAITANVLPFNTYGWSAEEVLLEVFDVQTTRNYAVAEKLGIMLDFIADEKHNESAIKAKFYELELDKLSHLQSTDPLKSVYDTILKEYVL